MKKDNSQNYLYITNSKYLGGLPTEMTPQKKGYKTLLKRIGIKAIKERMAKGGKVKAKKMTKKQRVEHAIKMNKARWNKAKTLGDN